MAAAAADTRAVSSSVPPGGSSISNSALAKSSGGMKATGMISHARKRPARKNTMPNAMVFQRFAIHQRNIVK